MLRRSLYKTLLSCGMLAYPSLGFGQAAEPDEGEAAQTEPSEAAPAQPRAEPTRPGAAQPEPPAEGAARPAAAEDPNEVEPGAEPAQADPQPADEQAAPSPEVPGAAPVAPLPAAPLPTWPEPDLDAQRLERQGAAKPAVKAEPGSRVFAEDWWSHARPMLELHGYFRVRAQLYHQFSLDRVDVPSDALWPQPGDNAYQTPTGSFGPQLCTPAEVDLGDTDSFESATLPCDNNMQAGANLRFRLNPELVVSDNVRIVSQIDLLDNLVLGTTPAGRTYTPASTGAGYQVGNRSGYFPLGVYESTQVPPASGINSLQDSISVKRAWGEYSTPVGQLRFGRMPSHWGLGIFQNSGDGHDDNYQTTVDRIAMIAGVPSLDLYIAGAWDFPFEGATSTGFSPPGVQPYDVAQLDDVDQYVLSVFRRKSPQLTNLSLAQGKVVWNGGAYLMYQSQLLANDFNGTGATCGAGAASLDCDPGQATGFVRRNAELWIPDVWLQVLYKKFRFELEAVTVQGSIDNLETQPGAADYENPAGEDGWELSQWGLATELEQRFVEDRLRLNFRFGWASGDPDVEGLTPDRYGVQEQLGDRSYETFRFHPAYKLDLILYRNILSRVQGTYYFRPSVDYDFMRKDNGQKIGGGVAVIWSRASEFIQAPGHARDLGIELNGQLYFQSKDGLLNDDPANLGGFFTKLEYGVLFPMAGLGYQPGEVNQLNSAGISTDIGTAQTLRWYLGIFF